MSTLRGLELDIGDAEVAQQLKVELLYTDSDWASP